MNGNQEEITRVSILYPKRFAHKKPEIDELVEEMNQKLKRILIEKERE